MKRLGLAAFVFVLLAAVGLLPVLAGSYPRGNVGQPIQYPANMPQIENTQLVLQDEPLLTMPAPDKVVLSFETAMPCPAVRAYFGVMEPDQKWPLPRYRIAVKEDLAGRSTEHRIVLDLGALSRRKIDLAQLKKNNGGHIVYRLEIYNPQSARSVFFDRAFAYHDGRRVPTIIEGPFIDLVTPTSAVVSWDTDLPMFGKVLVGERTFSGGPEAKTHFEVNLRDLTPGSAHRYRVHATGGRHSFTTREFTLHTPPEKTEHFTFSIMGDSREGVGGGERQFGGTNYRALVRFFTAAAEGGAQFIIHSGDMINGYTTSVRDFEMQLRAFKQATGVVGHSVPVYEVMGNHEATLDVFDDNGKRLSFDKPGPGSAETLFARHFVNPPNGPAPETAGAPPYAENVYYFDYGNARFVIMNNNYWYVTEAEKYGGNLEGYVLDRQTRWLKQVFADTAADEAIDHLFLVAQEAMFPNGGHAHDGMWYNGGDPAQNHGVDRRYVVDRRDEIWAAFVATGKAVAGNFGDEHSYHRTLIDKSLSPRFEHSVWQIVSGGVGAPFYTRRHDLPWSQYVKVYTTQMNYTMVTVDGPRVTLKAYGFTGELLDEVVLKE